MKTLCLILLSLALVSCETADFTLDEGVVVLTTDNFDKALEEFEYVLVEFYAPWCGHCQRLAPEYADAAQKLAKDYPNIRLAKVDATENQDLGDKYEVAGFPTIKWIKKGSDAIDYNGGRTSNEIINWVTRRTGHVSTEVKTLEDLETYITSSDALALFIGTSESSHFQDFVKAVTDLDQVIVVNSNDDQVKEKYGNKENSVVVFNSKGKEKHVFDGSASQENFEKFITENQFPAVAEFNQATVVRVFQGGQEAIVLLKAKNDAGAKAEETFTTVANKLKSEIIFTVANFDEDLGGRVAEFLGVPEEELPTLRIIHPANDMKKFKLEGEITEENIEKFVSGVKSGEIKPFLRSAPAPEEPYDGNVRVIVSSTWEEVVMDKTKDVLVEFYAPWCGHCQNLAPIYEGLAAKYRSTESLVIAKMDATANEVEGLVIEGFPTIRLYTKDDKENPIEYESQREERNFIRFLKKHDAIPKDGVDEEPSDEIDQGLNLEDLLAAHGDDHHGHDHDHDHDHDHGHDHGHKADDEL